MISARMAAYVYTGFVGVVVLFQLALAAGAPWGDYAMGGAYPGVFPPAMRVAAVIQAVILSGLAAVVLARAGVALPRLAKVAHWLAWIVVGVSALSMVMNLITPSGVERMVWAPVAILMFLCSLRVATSRDAPPLEELARSD